MRSKADETFVKVETLIRELIVSIYEFKKVIYRLLPKRIWQVLKWFGENIVKFLNIYTYLEAL